MRRPAIASVPDTGDPPGAQPCRRPLVVIRLRATIPALPARDVGAAVCFYRDRLGFAVPYEDEGFAVVRRDGAVVHVWRAGDESWRDRRSWTRPVQSGAESFLAGTASCRIEVEGVDALWAECSASGLLHPATPAVSATDFGTREFAVLDRDGNLVTFFERAEQA